MLDFKTEAPAGDGPPRLIVGGRLLGQPIDLVLVLVARWRPRRFSFDRFDFDCQAIDAVYEFAPRHLAANLETQAPAIDVARGFRTPVGRRFPAGIPAHQFPMGNVGILASALVKDPASPVAILRPYSSASALVLKISSQSSPKLQNVCRTL